MTVESLRPASEEEVLAAWVRAEKDSPRFGGALASAREVNPTATDAELLAVTRGWPDTGYFTDFPSDIRWSLVRLTPSELCAVQYINWDYWLEVTGGTRMPADAARRMSWTDGLSPQDMEPLILLTDTAMTRLVVVEGHSRLTGYVIGAEDLPAQVDCYLGKSQRAPAWGCF